MAQTVREIMTENPVTLPRSASISEAAKRMRDDDIGDVIVMDDGDMCGLVTDRDIVVRAVAEGADPQFTKVDEICTHELVTVGPDDSLQQTVQLMRERAVRRVPVVEGGRPVGIVSLGDLAIELDERSGLADISAAESNN
ncbi:MAG TPA: CBS domain-containing protein [Acidimicrobiales bacterium]|jgi:CBS domain-containing protein|nr:CBS domain-containing protein [Acidimicrobiales bacterium]